MNVDDGIKRCMGKVMCLGGRRQIKCHSGNGRLIRPRAADRHPPYEKRRLTAISILRYAASVSKI